MEWQRNDDNREQQEPCDKTTKDQIMFPLTHSLNGIS